MEGSLGEFGAAAAFKPPSRPGSSLKGRKSTAALAERSTNTPTPPMYRIAKGEQSSIGSPDDANAISSREDAASPQQRTTEMRIPSTSSLISKEAQSLAATESARQRLSTISSDIEQQTTAVALLGQGLLTQKAKIQELQEELQLLLDEQEANGEAGRNPRISELMEKIDNETDEMVIQRKRLMNELMRASGDQLPLAPLPTSASAGSFSFLNSDPAGRSTPTQFASSGDVTTSPPGHTPRQTSRRARNAAAPSSHSDHNLVNQLQEGLVQEIRRLQNLLLQRDQQIKLSAEEKKRTDEEIALWKPKAMTLMEQEDAIKQENWDLQVSSQQLQEQLDEERSALKKAEMERLRLTRDLAKSRETADERKVQLDGQVAELQRVQTLRETEIALARREKAAMQREFSDLQSEVTKYKAEAQRLERANISRSISHSYSLHSSPGMDDSRDSVLAMADNRNKMDVEVPPSPGNRSDLSSADQGPTRFLQDREVSDLRGKLAIAQKKSGKDSAEKRKLREQNVELRKLLQKAGVEAPSTSDVESTDDDEDAWVSADGKAGDSHKRKTRAKIPKSSTRPNIAGRLGLRASSSGRELSEEEADDAEEWNDSLEHAEPEDADASNSASADGMDPAFAEVLSPSKRKQRRSTIKPNKRLSIGSPLARNVVLSEDSELGGDDDSFAKQEDSVEEPTRRMPTGRASGGVRMRPASTIVAASALGNELAGLGEEPDEAEKSNTATVNADGSLVIREAEQVERDLSEQSVQTRSLDELLRPALEAQEAEHQQTIADLEAEHQNAISQLEIEHQTHRDAAAAGVQTLRDRHAEDLSRLQSTHQSEHEEAIAQLQAIHQSKYDAGVAELQARHKAQIEQLETDHKSATLLLKSQHQAKLDELSQSHVQAAREKDDKAAANISELERTHADALAEKDTARAAAIAAALASQSQLHDNAVSEARSRHTQALADQVDSHTKSLGDAKAEHRQTAEQMQSLHDNAIERLQDSHSSAIEKLNDSHAKSLADQEQSHARDLQAHDAARVKETEKMERRHQRAIAELEQNHQAMVDDIEATNDTFLAQRDAAFATALKERDDQLNKTRAEIQRVRSELEAVTAELAAANAELARLRAENERLARQLSGDASHHEAALMAARTDLENIKSEKSNLARALEATKSAHESSMQALAAELEKTTQNHESALQTAKGDLTRAASENVRHKSELQAAKDSLERVNSEKAGLALALSAAQAAHQSTMLAHEAEMDLLRKQQAEAEAAAQVARAQAEQGRRQSVDNDVFEDAVNDSQAKPIAASDEEGIRKVSLADLKDAGIQTDDEIWSQIQQERLMLRPSSIATARPGETAVGAGGVMVLDGHSDRVRDSIGTFGTLPTDPNSYTVSDLEGTDSSETTRSVAPDMSKPPTIAAPPPPSMPPPKKTRRQSAASTVAESDISAPARPTSPPPAKLIARTSGRHTPLNPSVDEAHMRSGYRASARPAQPPTAYAPGRMSRQTSSVSVHEADGGSIMSRLSAARQGPVTSAASIASDLTSEYSRRPSVVSEHIGDETITAPPAPRLSTNGLPAQGTDPAIIKAITETMIGEYLFKYTRKTMRGGHSDKRHRRYFWVHPYTNTLYWTLQDPAGASVVEGTSKSACIEDVHVVDDPNTTPAGTYHKSIVIKTANRELKITAGNRDRHEVWLNALGYLVNRGDANKPAALDTAAAIAPATSSSTITGRRGRSSTMSRMLTPTRSLLSLNRRKSTDSVDRHVDETPNYKTKRRDTAARDYLERESTTRSASKNKSSTSVNRPRASAPSSFVDEMGRYTPSPSTLSVPLPPLPNTAKPKKDPLLQTAEEMLEENEALGYEGLENVRACCGGAHDVGALAHKHHQQKARKSAGGPYTSSGTVNSMSSRLGAGPGLGSISSRPSSRLSNVSSTSLPRSRNSSTAPSQAPTSPTGSNFGSVSTLPPLLPQLGPITLNKPRASTSSSVKGKGRQPESLSKLFDLPSPTTPTASGASRPISPRPSDVSEPMEESQATPRAKSPYGKVAGKKSVRMAAAPSDSENTLRAGR